MAVKITNTGEGLIRSTSLLDYNAPYTWMVWLTQHTLIASSVPVLNISDNTTSNIDRVDTSTNGNTLRLRVNNVGQGTTTTISAFSLALNTPTHVCMRRNSNASLDLLVNGTVVITDTRNVTTATNNRDSGTHDANTMTLSGNNTGSSGLRANYQDEKRWQRALTDAEIAIEMQHSDPVSRLNLVGGSRFINDGTLLTDTTSTGGSAWSKVSSSGTEASSSDILTRMTGTAVSVTDFADVMATLSATLTDAASSVSAIFENSIDGGVTWTNSNETTLSTTGTAPRTTTGHTTGMVPASTAYFRALFNNPPSGSIIQDAYVYIGGGSAPGTPTTLLTRAAFGRNRNKYPGANMAWFSTAPATGSDSNDTAASIDGVEYVSWMKDENQTMLDSIVSSGYAGIVTDQRLALEIKISGSATAASITIAQATNTWCWDATSVADFQAAIRADEDMLQHTASPHSATNRNLSGTSYWLLNPSNATVLACMRRSMIRRHMTVAANSVTASRRRQGVHLDNVDASNGARGNDAIEFGASFTSGWSTAQVAMLQNLHTTGVFLSGNLTGSDPSTSGTPSRRQLSNQIGSELDMMYHEGMFAPPSVSFGTDATYGTTRVSTGDAAVSGTDYAWTPVKADLYLSWLDNILGRTTDGTAYKVNMGFVGIGYIYDQNKNDTVSTLQLRYVWGLWMLGVDSTRLRAMFRSADSSNNGYDRLRYNSTVVNIDTGNPLEDRQIDANSGNAAVAGSTSTKRVRYRRFANGCLVMNLSIETSVPYNLSAVNDPSGTPYGTGTLDKLEVKWLPASAGSTVKHRSVRAGLLAGLRRGLQDS